MHPVTDWPPYSAELDFAAWAVKCLFRGEGEAPASSAAFSPCTDTRSEADDSTMAQLQVDGQWELALQRELMLQDSALAEQLLRRGALPSSRRAPIVEFVRSAAGRDYVRRHFRACVACYASQLEAHMRADGLDPDTEYLASVLSQRLAHHADALRRLLELPEARSEPLFSAAVVDELLSSP